jgi:putative acetyltransferase
MTGMGEYHRQAHRRARPTRARSDHALFRKQERACQAQQCPLASTPASRVELTLSANLLPEQGGFLPSEEDVAGPATKRDKPLRRHVLFSSEKETRVTVNTIEIELANARSPDLISLVAALDDFLNRVCGVERNHGSPIDRLAHDDTQMFIARIGGQAVGCAGLQVFEDGTGEVKRMYVVTEARRTGIGSRLLMRVVEAALTAKLSVLRLETTEFLSDALRLYRAKGFMPCPAYGPYISNPINLYFEKWLMG